MLSRKYYLCLVVDFPQFVYATLNIFEYTHYKLFAGCQGYYCKGGSWTATPLAGMVHPETGEVVDIGDICPPNHFCIEGVSQPTACPVYAHLCMLVLAEFATNSAEVD